MRNIVCCKEQKTDLILKYAVKCLDNASRMPPLWGLDLVGNGCRGSTSLCLYLADRSKPSSRESLLEFTGQNQNEISNEYKGMDRRSTLESSDQGGSGIQKQRATSVCTSLALVWSKLHLLEGTDNFYSDSLILSAGDIVTIRTCS